MYHTRPMYNINVHHISLQSNELVDGRSHCCLLETGDGSSHYLSVESRQQMLHLEKAWHRATVSSVTALAVSVYISLAQSQCHLCYGSSCKYSSSRIWKGVSATLQSGRYTLSYPRERYYISLAQYHCQLCHGSSWHYSSPRIWKGDTPFYI